MASVTSQGVSMDEKSSPTTSGPDSDVASVEEDLPKDNFSEEEGTTTGTQEDLSTKVSAGANYIGSMFSSAWTKTAKTANDATTSSSTFFTSAFNKVGVGANGTPMTSAGNSAKSSPKDENKPIVEENVEEQKKNISASASAFFTSAWNKVGTFSASSNNTACVTSKSPEATEENSKNDEEETTEEQKSYFSNFSNMVGKVANNASTAIKDKVGNVGMIGEFNKQQEDFIKNKGPCLESGLAPWVGSCDEEAMKAKILSLSNDNRNFLRAPPPGVTFEFDYNSVSATALALLAEDPQLEKMRYELVPKSVKEDEFWRNYFYRVNLIKQSVDLKDLESNNSSTSSTKAKQSKMVKEQNNHQDSEEIVDNSGNDGDDEFVSESYQASSKDIKEANASMKRLGVKGKENEEWEAELEGELNEFEMVSSKGDAEDGSNDPEWENQIEQMLEAEEKEGKQN